MGSFDDLDDALLESVLRWLNSTELRNTASLVCKRWHSICNSRPGLWRYLEINVAWEIYHPHGPGPRPSVAPHRGIHLGGGRGGRGSQGRGRGLSASGGGVGRPHRPAFLSRAAISRWLQPRAHAVQVLHIRHTEIRATVAGQGFGISERHDLQPPDLSALLAALPSLTELHLDGACDLLPDPSALLLLQHSNTDSATAASAPPAAAAVAVAAAAAAPQPLAVAVAAAAAAAAAATAAAVAQAAVRQHLLLPAAPASAPALSERLCRLSLCRAGYDFSMEEGAAQAGALGALRALQELSIRMEPAAPEGLSRLPEPWSALTGLTALRLGGHQRLRRLPRWLSSCLRRLRELELEGCGLRRMPAAALVGLPQLRLLSLDHCPLGCDNAAVSLDAWWPPEEEQQQQEEGGSAGASGASGAAKSTQGEERGGGRGGGGGVSGLEVLQLRSCNILALPYTVTRLINLRRLELGDNPLGEMALVSHSGRRVSRMWDSVLRYLRESGDRGFGQLAVLTRLGHLGLARCGLRAVPQGVADLTQITSLDLSYNPELELYPGHVADLPERLSRLASLRLVQTGAGQELREAEQHWEGHCRLILE